jgi:hypothetical protein
MNDIQGKGGILKPARPELGKTHVSKGKTFGLF